MENERLEFKDDFIESVLDNANRKSLTNDFERGLMKKIHNSHTHKKGVASRLKKSMSYFFIGMFFMGTCSLMLIFGDTLFRGTIGLWPILTLFSTIVAVIVFANNYKRFFKLVYPLNGEGLLTEFSK